MPNSSPATSEISVADIELIDYFVRGKKRVNASSRLQIEHADNAMKLLDRRGGLVAVSKQVNEWQQKILLHNQAEEYMSVLCAALEGNDFLATRKSRHPDFVEYSKYQTPMGYDLHYQSAKIMGRAWLDHYARPSRAQSRGLLVFHGSNWYPIQELKIDQHTMHLRTLVGEWTIDSGDFVVWIEVSSSKMPSTPVANKKEVQTPPVISKKAQQLIETPETPSQPAQQLVTESLSSTRQKTKQTLSESLTTTKKNKSEREASSMITEGESISDLITEFKLSAVPTPPSSDAELSEQAVADMLAAVKAKAIKRLFGYLKNGETVITTEVLTNGQGQIITTKTTEVKRGCPRWVVEQVKAMSDI
jgi:hypothetical protein